MRIAAMQGNYKKEENNDVTHELDVDNIEEDKQSVSSEKSFMTDFTVIDNNEIHNLTS
tara:strand:- start:430 stop:603 length:174 start_codon:yes stop_codon:yes gene_type:complete